MTITCYHECWILILQYNANKIRTNKFISWSAKSWLLVICHTLDLTMILFNSASVGCNFFILIYLGFMVTCAYGELLQFVFFFFLKLVISFNFLLIGIQTRYTNDIQIISQWHHTTFTILVWFSLKKLMFLTFLLTI